MLPPLNLPTFDYKIKKIEGKNYIFDVIRRKYLVLTPEEWVRQHWVHLLSEHYHYPKSLMKLEGGLKYNKLSKRSDIVIFNTAGSAQLLIECKSPQITINQSVIEQASRYNQVLKAPYLALSNGLQSYCFEIDFEKMSFKQLEEIPFCSENSDENKAIES